VEKEKEEGEGENEGFKGRKIVCKVK